MRIIRLVRPFLALGAAIALAAGAGFLASTALSIGTQAPTKTTTITLTNGATGPTGPAGPTGPSGTPGAENCPTGSEFEALTIDHPGGHVTIWTCVAT
jgi:hypothetical protein